MGGPMHIAPTGHHQLCPFLCSRGCVMCLIGWKNKVGVLFLHKGEEGCANDVPHPLKAWVLGCTWSWSYGVWRVTVGGGEGRTSTASKHFVTMHHQQRHHQQRHTPPTTTHTTNNDTHHQHKFCFSLKGLISSGASHPLQMAHLTRSRI